MNRILLAFTIPILLSLKCRADNPIIQTIYTADPAPVVYEDKDTLYLYTGHDEDKSTWFVMKDWRCFTTRDMVNWTDHGSPLSLKNFSWAKSDAWAGQCIERKGKFYYYVPVGQTTGGIAVGVAVADGPTGPFKDPLGHPLVFDTFGDIDPTVFIDDDGQAYLAWGNPVYKYVKLNPDMISYDTRIGDKGIVRDPMTVEAFGKRESDPKRATTYEEGPWIYKRHNLYYLIYASGPLPEGLSYSTGPSPTGPWTYRGVIMPPEGASFTNHPGVVDFKGHTYLFYHNGGLPGGGGFTRSVCVDELKFKPDGSIVPMKMTKEGPTALASLNPYTRTEAETMAWSSGIKTEPNGLGGMNVCSIDDGDYILVRNVDFGTVGAASFLARISSDTKPKASKNGVIELHLDKVDGPLIGTDVISYTGGSDRWKDEVTNITGAMGVHDLYLVFKGETLGDLFKFDYWQFTPKSIPARLVALNASVDPYKINALPPGNKANLIIKAIYSDGTSKDVTKLARVTPGKMDIVAIGDGSVTGLKWGSTDLAISYDEKTDIVPVLVTDIKTEFTVGKLSANLSNLKMINGSHQPLTVTAEYLDGHTEDVTKTATYQADDSKIASQTDGIISAHAPGTTFLQVHFKGEMGSPASTRIDIAVINRDPFAQNKAEDFNDQLGAIAEACTEGGKNICNMANGLWLKYSSLDFGSGANSFGIRVASATQGGTLEIALDRLDGPIIGTCKVEGTGGWQSWVTRSCPVTDAKGVHDVYLKFHGDNGILFNVNWWKFDK